MPRTNKRASAGRREGDKVIFKSGASGSKIPRFELIPRDPLVRLVARLELGLEIHKERAWNGMADNKACLLDRAWLISRAGHVQDHAMKLIEKFKGARPMDDGEDDAAAIGFGFLALCEGTRAVQEANETIQRAADEVLLRGGKRAGRTG